MEHTQGKKNTGWLKRGIMAECVLILALAAAVSGKQERDVMEKTVANHVLSIENDYIKWVDFTVSYEALCKAYDWDVETHGTEHEIDWIELLAYTAAKTGGEFDRDALKSMEQAAEKLSEGETTIDGLTENLKYYSYYKEAYEAAIGGLVGEYWEENPEYSGDSILLQESSNENLVNNLNSTQTEGTRASNQDGAEGGTADEDGVSNSNRETTEKTETAQRRKSTGQDAAGGQEGAENGAYVKRYGLKGYFPLARGFDYTHFDDFGVGRSYGYQRKHLGHDMMGLVGTPIMAIESGVVTALGWNQYGGWRIGISSFDGKRYYYYAHLRQNYPYAEGLQEGSVVTAGDVIGYMGHTGYSAKENVNNIKIVHLHWGLQLIFDESQKEGNNEIWIDVYPLTRFLAKHTQAAVKVEGTKEWRRTNRIVDPAVEEYEALAPDGVQVPVKDDSLENSRTESQEVEQRLE